MAVWMLLILAAYLCGSLVSAVLICRMLGLPDPRGGGSGNPGATNILRLHGRRAAALTLAGDVLKGVAPVALARVLDAPPPVVALCGTAAFAGHLYPVFFGFRGGKGVATLIGVLAGTSWMLGLGFAATWLMMAAAFRYSSLASLTAAALTPLYTWWLLAEPAYVACFTLVALVLAARHRSNIRNLILGRESKISLGRA